jgi:hypothetical protein
VLAFNDVPFKLMEKVFDVIRSIVPTVGLARLIDINLKVRKIELYFGIYF